MRLTSEQQGLGQAAALLRSGEVVAFPTETVYGLGADARSAEAVSRIFSTKGRPAHNPLIVHVLDLAAAEALAVFDDRARRVAARFWPGPLTLVLLSRGGLAPQVSAGLPTLALRVPSHPVARALLAQAGCPVAAPSANRSGEPSPTDASHVVASLGDRVPVLEAGPSTIGLESTVLSLAGEAVLLRLGAVTRDMLEAVLGPISVSEGNPDQPTAPGQLLRHYAPSVPVRLEAERPRNGEAWMGFGPDPSGLTGVRANLSPAGDVVEAASNLYRLLRELDQPGVTGIAVAHIPCEGVGAAVNDRLTRAARATRSGFSAP